MIWTFGYVAANVIGIYATSVSPDAWKWMLASSAIPAVIILVARIGSPESPRWLASKGRHEEALQVVQKYFGPNVILEDPVEQQQVQESKGFMALFHKDMIHRTLFNCIFWVCLVMPYFAIYTFLPIILDEFGLQQGFGVDLLLNGLLIIGAVLGIWFTIKFTRRGFLISSFVVLIISLGLLSILPSNSTVLMIIAFSVFTLILSAVSNLVGVFPAESFPTDIRSSGIGLATAISRLGSAASTFILPMSMASIGVQNTMLCLTGILIIGLIVSVAWAPETKTLSLSEAGDTHVH